ncbi:MAG: hypothetical protein RQ824_06295 [bacterium]|nr:hypothetical protein [bacterium]
MAKKIMAIIAGLFFLLIFIQPAAAGNSGVAVGVKAGTLGAGAEATVRLTDKLNLRLGGNQYSKEETGVEDDIEYDIELKLSSAAALFDWHPFGGVFRITAGALLNGNELEFDARPATTYTIGDTTYTIGEVGQLHGKVDFDDVAPYASIGWGNAVGKNRNITFSFELGAVFQGSPNVDLTATGTSASDLAFQAELQKEEDNLQDELDDYKIYPVAAIGLSYHF